MVYNIINKNVLDALKDLPDESVDCIITSPPYYSKRQYKGNDVVWGDDVNCEHEWIPYKDYKDNLRFRDPNKVSDVGNNANIKIFSNPAITNSVCSKCGAWKGQLGLEPIYQMYIEHLMMVTRELKRVLKKTGVLFWNIDDSSASSGGSSRHRGYPDPKWLKGRAGDFDEPAAYNQGIKPKSMMLLPERFALAMIDDGWILRNKIIWYKRNGQPNSTKDRFTRKWEYVFFFVKSKKYYFDLDSVRKPFADPDRMNRAVSGKRYSTEDAKEALLGNPHQGIHKPRPNIKKKYEGIYTNLTVEESEMYGSPRARNLRKQKYEENSSYEESYFNEDRTIMANLKGANPRDVFESKYIDDMEQPVASPAGRVMRNLANGKTTTLVREAITNVNQYLKGKLKDGSVSLEKLAEISGETETQIAHYFRTDESGCALPNRNFWDKVKDILGLDEYDMHVKEEYKSVMLQFNSKGANPGDIINTPAVRTKSWFANAGHGFTHKRKYEPDADGGDFWDITTLAHDFAHFAVFPETLVMPLIKSGCPVGGTVLDPFAGSGTTGVVAEILGRNSILVEISDEYVGIINERFKPENIEKVKKKLLKIKPKSNQESDKVAKANKLSNLDNFIEVEK